MTELEKLEQSVVYCNRYFEFEDAVKINRENIDYLKTYIHDNDYVVKNFDLKGKVLRSMIISGGAGIAVLVLLMLILIGAEGIGRFIIPVIAGVVVFVATTIFFISFNKFRLSEAEKNQVEVNAGIKEQIDILSSRENQLVRQKEDFYKALVEKNCCVIPLEYMSNAEQIRDYVKNGEAQTVEEAIDMFEQKLLMQEMSSIMTKSEEAPKKSNRERFGDPLEIIKQNKKNKKKK